MFWKLLNSHGDTVLSIDPFIRYSKLTVMRPILQLHVFTKPHKTPILSHSRVNKACRKPIYWA